jgi:tRNA A37 methylthiotransferase MiaB
MGCPRNQMDTAWISSYFQANGWKLVRNAGVADMVVTATCGFAAHIEDESIRRLSLLDERRRSDSRLVVIGCLSGINPTRITREFDATVIRPADIHQLDEIIGASVPLASVPPVNCIESHVLAASACWTGRELHPDLNPVAAFKHRIKTRLCSLLKHPGMARFAVGTLRKLCRQVHGGSAHPTFYIRVARGCLEECTYCAIRYAAGKLRSKQPASILAEFDRGLAQKHRVFEIVAEDIGSYGLDIGTNCAELLDGFFSRSGSYKLILTDVNVRYLIELSPLLSDVLAGHVDRIQRITIPVQSGSDRILQRMKRRYTSAEAKAALSDLRQKAPTLRMETHILVGFPGETEADFQATLDLIKSVRFDWIQAYRYTDRPGTAASAMTDKIPASIQRERLRRLRDEFAQVRTSAVEDRHEDSGHDDDNESTPSVKVAPAAFGREPSGFPTSAVAFDRVSKPAQGLG